MKILGIETATEACSASVLCDGEIMEQFELAPQRHNELILPMCESLLSEFSLALNQLDAVAFGCGPGAFTGVRIAAGVTQGIALAHALPVIPISTLANLAQQALVQSGQIETVMPAIDARMHEVYWAIYKKNANGLAELSNRESVQAPAEISCEGEKISYGLGTGWKTYAETLQEKACLAEESVDGEALPRARFTVLLAKQKFLDKEMVDAANALPVYLRDNVTHQK